MNTRNRMYALSVIACAVMLVSCRETHDHTAKGVIMQSYMGYSAWSGEICFSSIKLINNSRAITAYGVCGKIGDTVRVYGEQCAAVCDKCRQQQGDQP